MSRKNFLNILILLLVVLIMAVVVVVMPTRRVTKQKAALGTVNVLLNPPDKTLAIGEETTVAIHLVNEGQKKISFVNIGLSFDQTKLEIVRFTPNPATFPNDFTANDPGLLGRTTGIASLQVGSTAASAGLPSAAGISIGSITIKGKSAGVSQMVILRSGDKASQIVGDDPNWTPNIGDQGEGLVLTIGSVQNGTYTVSGGATNTPTATTTPGTGARTWYLDDGVAADPTTCPAAPNGTTPQFKTPYKAVECSRNGDKIIVKSGNYPLPEILVIDKSLILEGENAQQKPVFSCTSNIHFIKLQSDNITVTKIRVTGCSSGATVAGRNVVVSGNEFSQDIEGVFVEGTGQATIRENNFGDFSVNGSGGIGLGGSSRAVIENNKIDGSGNVVGVLATADAVAEIKNNVISNTKTAISGSSTTRLTIDHNTINGIVRGYCSIVAFGQSQVVVKNNIFTGIEESDQAMRKWDTPVITLDYNLYCKNTSNCGDPNDFTGLFSEGITKGAHDLKADPKYGANPTYCLGAGSPAIGSGESGTNRGAVGPCSGGVTGTPTPSLTPTITPTPLPGPRLSFKVKFQGVDGRPVDSDQYTKRVKVRVVKGDLNETFDADVTSDDQGVFSGSVVLSEVPVGSGYAIFIKGPQHLARKFCVNNQAERCVGPGAISLAEGNNNFDFSKLVLEAGDLQQDGVVNSVDYSLWKARVGLTVPEALVIADVDFDGIVGGHDWMLMRNTLETKYEEDY